MGFSTMSLLLVDTNGASLRGRYGKVGSMIAIVATDDPYTRADREGEDDRSTGPPRPRQYNETGSPEKLRRVIDTLEPAIRLQPRINVGWMAAELGYNGVMYATGEMTADEALRRSRNSITETVLSAVGGRVAKPFFKGSSGRSMEFLTGELFGMAGEKAYVHMDGDESSNPNVSERRGYYSFRGPPRSSSSDSVEDGSFYPDHLYNPLRGPTQSRTGSVGSATTTPIGPRPDRPGFRSPITVYQVEEPSSPTTDTGGSSSAGGMSGQDRSTVPWQDRAIFSGGSESTSPADTSGGGSSQPPATPGTGGHAPAPMSTNRAKERQPGAVPASTPEPSGSRHEPRLDELESALTENAVEETMNRVRGEISIR